MNREDFHAGAARIFDIPADTQGGLLHVEMTGNREVFVENFKGIKELSENEVIINAGRRDLRIIGDKLRIAAMNSNELRLFGNIGSISFCP